MFQKKTSTYIIGYKLRNSCLILIIFDTKIPHIIRGAPDPDPDLDPAGYPVDLVDPVQIRIRPDPISQDPV